MVCLKSIFYNASCVGVALRVTYTGEQLLVYLLHLCGKAGASGAAVRGFAIL